MRDVSPIPFMDGVIAYQTTAALKAAVELDLFSAIAEGADTPETLAHRTGAVARGLRILANFLTVRGYLHRQDGRYRLTADTAAFLDRHSPTYLGSMVEFVAAPEMLALALNDPAMTVRSGGASGSAQIAGDSPVWVKFARAMAPVAKGVAQVIADQVVAWPVPPRMVLDIAAGHGLYGILLAKAVPTAQVTAVDWTSVLAVARENAINLGVSDRYRTIAGSAFEVDWGDGYDLVLLTGFLHHFDQRTCVALLRKVRTALASSGRVLVTEFVPNADRISPPMPAAFAFTMLLATPSGDAYTAEDLDAMARGAGFRGITTTSLAPSPQTLVEFLR